MSNIYSNDAEPNLGTPDAIDAIAFWGEAVAARPLSAPSSLAALANPLSAAQWYLTRSSGSASGLGSGAESVFDSVTGRGVSIGIVDSGFDTRHRDLASRFDMAASFDPRDRTILSLIPDRPATEQHGTWTAGVLGADGANDWGVIGVAHGADLVGNYIRLGEAGSSRAEIAGLLGRQSLVDVSNNSWGYTAQFHDNIRDYGWSGIGDAIRNAAVSGRDGLGTVMVFAAGNDRQYVAGNAKLDGDNTNYHSLTNSRFATAVAASDLDGRVATFSTPGASVLVAAPGTSIFTTSVDNADGNPDNDFAYVSGTSFAAPIVSGVVALMLEANADLGYRDIRDILAYSATRTALPDVQWSRNDAADWNGGGLLFNHDLGFGVVDARAAVRLAQTWTAPARTAANEVALVAGSANGLGAAIAEGGAGTVLTVDVDPASSLRAQSAELDLTIIHPHVGDLVVRLVSPSGTQSVLVDRPGAGTNGRDNLRVTLSSVHFAGEQAAGQWRVIVEDNGTGGSGYVEAFELRLFGDRPASERSFVFTDALAMVGPANIDADEGRHVLNAAAVSGGMTLSLAEGTGTIAGQVVSIAATTTIATVFLGEGADILTGSERTETIHGGAGADTIAAGAGDDLVQGEDGHDLLSGGAGDDRLVGGAGSDTLLGQDGDDRLEGGADADVLAGGAGSNHMEGGAGDDSYIVESATDTLTELPGDGRDIVYSYVDHALGENFEVLSLFGGARRGVGNGLDNLIVGSAGDDEIDGGAGDDTLYGGAGDDVIRGGEGRDYLIGMDGADTLVGGAGDDTYIVQGLGSRAVEEAGGGVDVVYALIDHTLEANIETLVLVGNDLDGAGNESDNVIIGTGGDNVLSGGAGIDTLYGGAGNDRLIGGAGIDTLVGGSDGDVFVWASAAEGGDMLLDFLSGEDRIELAAADFGLSAGTMLTAGLDFFSDAAPLAREARASFLFDSAAQQLWFDSDGSGAAAATLLFTIMNPQQLLAADIALV